MQLLAAVVAHEKVLRYEDARISVGRTLGDLEVVELLEFNNFGRIDTRLG